MTRSDTGRILTLLKTLYPNASQLRGDFKTIVEAWFLILRDYDYQDVKAAAITWNAGEKGKYCPDARELIPERRQTERPPDRTYSSNDLLQAWRQNCWAFDHKSIVPDDWVPDADLLKRMAAYAPREA